MVSVGVLLTEFLTFFVSPGLVPYLADSNGGSSALVYLSNAYLIGSLVGSIVSVLRLFRRYSVVVACISIQVGNFLAFSVCNHMSA